LSNDIVLHGEESVEEDEESQQGGRQQPSSVESSKRQLLEIFCLGFLLIKQSNGTIPKPEFEGKADLV
jgi:hypothetical protein